MARQSSTLLEISRARDRAELVTDDAARLRERLELTTGERISALEAVAEAEAVSSETAGKARRGLKPEEPEQARESRPQPETSAPSGKPAERVEDGGRARDRKPEEPAREKGIELELDL